MEEMNREMMMKSKKYAMMQRPATAKRTSGDGPYGYIAEEEYVAEEEQEEPQYFDRQSDLSGE